MRYEPVVRGEGIPRLVPKTTKHARTAADKCQRPPSFGRLFPRRRATTTTPATTIRSTSQDVENHLVEQDHTLLRKLEQYHYVFAPRGGASLKIEHRHLPFWDAHLGANITCMAGAHSNFRRCILFLADHLLAMFDYSSGFWSFT